MLLIKFKEAQRIIGIAISPASELEIYKNNIKDFENCKEAWTQLF